MKLGVLRGIRELSIAGNPVGEELGDGLRKEILIAMDHMHFKRIGKDEITPEELQEAAAEKEQRRKDEEAAKLKAEEEGEENKGEEEEG